MDLDLDLDSIFNGFGSGFGFKCVLGLDWILDLKKFMDLDLDLDLFLDMDSNPNPRIQIRTSLLLRTKKKLLPNCPFKSVISQEQDVLRGCPSHSL